MVVKEIFLQLRFGDRSGLFLSETHLVTSVTAVIRSSFLLSTKLESHQFGSRSLVRDGALVFSSFLFFINIGRSGKGTGTETQQL